MIERLIDRALEFLFPSNIYCIACGNLIDNQRPYALCDKCVEEIKWITDNSCTVCGKDLGHISSKSGNQKICFECMEVKHIFDKGFSCATYEGPVKEILSDFKYKAKPYYAQKIVDAMCDKAESFMGELNVDIIIPIPMHPKKLKDRGYNQSQLLAKGFSNFFNIRLEEEILIKTRLTASMSSLSSTERRINLHNTLAIGYNRENEVKNKSILLVDDVYTTGSTADACAEVLKENGAKEVNIFTFASGVNMKPKLS